MHEIHNEPWPRMNPQCYTIPTNDRQQMILAQWNNRRKCLSLVNYKPKLYIPSTIKKYAYPLAHEMSFVCIAYFYPKKYTLTPKLKVFSLLCNPMYWVYIGLGVHISLTIALHTIALQCKKRSPSRSHRSRSTTLEINTYILGQMGSK
jgi:hypothetical protein